MTFSNWEQPNQQQLWAFQQAMAFVFQWEGGFVNDPDDPGGATNLGVTQATYDSWRTRQNLPRQSVKLITKAEAVTLYAQDYWRASQADQIAAQSPAMALVVFNCAVNMGVSRAQTLLTQSQGNIEQFLRLQEGLYRTFAANGQQKFLQGWLNRMLDLRKTVVALGVAVPVQLAGAGAPVPASA